MRKLSILVLCILFIGCSNNTKKMKDLSSLSKNDIDNYAKENKLNVKYINTYNNIDKGKVVTQSIKSGDIIHENDNLIIELSLGRLTEEEYKNKKVNELGRIPVMMYHGIHDTEAKYIGGNIDKDGYQRTSEAFENDLEFYYNSGYRMIRLEDYIQGKIDVELGYSPIVITFDDGLSNNIKVTGLDDNGNIIIDPKSAIGILEEFKKKHPDANVTATFFINGGIFNQKEYNEKILKWMVDNGYDIGNHTWTHVNFKKASVEDAQIEVGKIYELLDKYIPGKYVNIVALPFGSPGVKSHKTYPYILNGKYNDIKYNTESTLRVGWEADYSPYSNSFDKTFIKRIRAYDNNGKDFDIEYNFKLLEKSKYISDGNINNIVIPNDLKNNIKENYDLNIITY